MRLSKKINNIKINYIINIKMNKLEITNGVEIMTINKDEAEQIDNAITESRYSNEWYYLGNQLYNFVHSKTVLFSKITVSNAQYNFILSILA